MKRKDLRRAGQNPRCARPGVRKKDLGFTLMEALISILVVMLGLLSLEAVYTQGLSLNTQTQYDYIAQAKAEEAMETIYAARDSNQVNWVQIQNGTGAVGGTTGIFLPGPQPLLAPGPDGIYGTSDDDPSNPNVIIAGPNSSGALCSSAGIPAPGSVVIPLTFMTRQIQIANVVTDGSVRQITITMTYTIGSSVRTYQLVSYISQPA